MVQGNTQTTTLTGLQDNTTGLFQNTWTNIVMTLIDDEGNPVVGCVQIPMNYIPGSNGNYQGTFGNASFYPPVGTGYTLLIDGSNSGSFLHIETLVEVKARKF